MATRKRGEGSIFSYQYGFGLKVTLQTPTGPVRKTVYGKTIDEVQAKASELKAKAAAGASLDPLKMGVGQLLERYLEQSKSRVKPSTYEFYRWQIERNLLPFVSAQPLKTFSAAHVEDLLKCQEQAGKSKAARGAALGILRQAMGYAIHTLELIPKDPTANVTRPKSPKRKATVWTEEQARGFLDEVAKHWLGPFVRLALSTGMRHGELLGLRWVDVNLKVEPAVISVQNTLVDLPGRPLELGPVKSDAGARLVYLTPEAREALKNQQSRLFRKGLLRADGFVFPVCKAGPGRGGPTRKRTIYGAWNRLLVKWGLPKIRIHDLRHTLATLLLKANVNPKKVQELLGHSDIRVTLGTYSHVMPSMREETAKDVKEVLG